jgi:YegS/Rv2252/BmrU family lipid kinase
MYYCFIYNKKASSGKKTAFIKKIYDNLKLFHQVDLFETSTEQEAEELFKKIVEKNYDRLIIAGGDGSVCFAINQLIKNNFQPKDNFAIGYVPAGTANILQAELGMSKNIKKISKTLMSNNLEKTNLVKINSNYFILMAGIGWDAQIVQSIDSKIKKILGKIIFGIKGLEKFIFMKSTKIKVNIDNEELLADWVLCSNSRYYAGHHKITDTNIFEEKFTTYIFKDLSRLKLLYYIFLIIFNGNLNKSTSVITKNTNEVKLKTFDKSIPIQIDGDNFGSLKDIVIKSSKRKFNLLKAA